MATSALLGFLGVFVVVLPLSVEAGAGQTSLKAFALDLFEKAQISAEGSRDRSLNSQTMTLLQPTGRPNPESARGGGEITIVEGTSLFPEAGPLGTAADIEGGVPPSGQISVYVVRKGDTIGGIAKMYGVSVNTIRWANDLAAGAILKEDETLLILPVSGVRHTVRAGDTLVSIAKKHGASLEDIARYNDIISDAKLAVGDTVIVPNGELEAAEPAIENRKPPRSRLPEFPGYYAHPLPGARKTQGIHGWNGVDLALYPGAPILASASGIVIVSRESGWNGGYGNYVVIAHENGTQTLYSHLASNAVRAGVTVAQGQVIGYEGSTGRSTGPHLHFEVRGAKNPF